MREEGIHQPGPAVAPSPLMRVTISGPGGDGPVDHVISGGSAIIGRGAGCEIRLEHPDLSYRHAWLQLIAGRLFCIDLLSRTGVHGPNGPQQAAIWELGASLNIGPYQMSLLELKSETPNDNAANLSAVDPLKRLTPELVDRLPELFPRQVDVARAGSLERHHVTVDRLITLIGRDPRCRFQFVSRGVSRVHAGLVLMPSGLYVVDLVSRGGIQVNGRRVPRTALQQGDVLSVSRFRLRVHAEPCDSASDPSHDKHRNSTDEAAGRTSSTQADQQFGGSESSLESRRSSASEAVPEETGVRESRGPSRSKEGASRTPRLLENRYELRERLPGGGMARVYRAYDRRLGRQVAVKFPKVRGKAKERLLKRFRREAVICGKLDHPNVVRIFDISRHGEHDYIVMEFVQGENLKMMLKRSGALEPETAVGLIVQLAEALGIVHERGVVHRDVKPSNLLLTPDGQLKLLDLGLARLDEDDQAQAELLRADEQLTAAGMKLGTFTYMAPEQAHDSHHADARSDIYSVGCTLYECLAGRPPFDGDNPVAVLLNHARDPVPPIPGLDSELTAILGRMLAKDPNERFQTAGELLTRLRAWQARR